MTDNESSLTPLTPEELVAKRLEDSGRAPLEAPVSQDPAEVSRIIERLNKARDERSVSRKEFDGMTFEQDYERNREATFSYLRPKKNDDDVRVNSGTSEKKVELMLNELLAFNFQPQVRAFDKNSLELVDFSVDLTDVVTRTNEIENDEDMYAEVYLDLLTQRAAFTLEALMSQNDKQWFGGEGKPSCKMARKRRLSPLQVYPGDMYIPISRLSEQPYIVIYDRMLYSEAKVLFSENENFQYVKPGDQIHEQYLPWFKYRFSSLKQDEVEVITYMSSSDHDDEFQQIINGVLMHKPGTLMPHRKGYPIAGATGKQIPDFFYGKPPIASAKFLQALQDETLRNLVRKMRQAIEPPLGVPNGKVYSRDIFSPGANTQGLNRDSFSRLVEHDGVTGSEFQMLQLITQKAEEFIGASNITNVPGSDRMTATQVIELMKQSIKMLGQLVLAVVRLKRDATFLRLGTFFSEYIEPTNETVDGDEVKNEYRSFEIKKGKLSNGDIVKKLIILIDRNLTPQELESVHEYEESESERLGVDIRYSFLNCKLLKSIPLLFHVEVVPEQRDSSALDRVLFQDRLSQAVQISQLLSRPLNGDKLIQDFETTWKAHGVFETTVSNQLGAGDPAVQDQANALLQKMGNPSVGNVPASEQAQSALSAISSTQKSPTTPSLSQVTQ